MEDHFMFETNVNERTSRESIQIKQKQKLSQIAMDYMIMAGNTSRRNGTKINHKINLKKTN